MDTIYEFQGRYRFLSNFFIEPDGTSVEVEYQAAKCKYPEDVIKFNGLTPAEAKRLGRKAELRDDWESLKIEVMHQLVTKKFMEHSGLRKQLLETGDVELIEGNHWGDRFWGRVMQGRGTGENQLGKILMQVRRELRT